MSFTTALSFVLVGACWGCTTPFIKDGTETDAETTADGVGSRECVRHSKDDDSPSRVKQILGPLQSLATAKAAIPFLLNQSGSLVYYFLLGSQDISMAVPVCNSLTFVFTAATAMWLGEEAERPLRTFLGMALVLVGIVICVASKAT